MSAGSASAWAEYVGTEYTGPIHICPPRCDLTMCGVTVQDDWVSRKPGLFSRQAVLPRGESLCIRCKWMTGDRGPRRRAGDAGSTQATPTARSAAIPREAGS